MLNSHRIDRCGFHQSENDWKQSDKIFLEAMDSLEKEITISRAYHVPYVAGYNLRGDVIYIDSRIPKGYRYRGKIFETDKFLVLHELIEKSLLNNFQTLYQFAHQMALRLEEQAVIAAGYDLRIYNQFMNKWIDILGKDPATNIPPDLDLKPYVDEDDRKELNKMKSQSGISVGDMTK